MITSPTLEDRAPQRYAGIRTQVPMSRMKKVVGPALQEIFAWLDARGVAGTGAPFLRLHVIDMAGLMDIEIGVPVADTVVGDGRVAPGVLPAGRYASLVYSKVSGIAGNRALLDWATANGVVFDRWDDPNGDAFRCRVEFFLTDPALEPDRKKWEMQVAIKLADPV